jgi:uncharacterized protein YjiS (DUF1127 family)
MRHDLDLPLFAGRRLTPEQWQHLADCVRTRAQVARARSLRGLFVKIPALARAIAVTLWAAVGNWWRAYALRRERRKAIRELRALDDRTLRDIGLGRSEIESVIYDPERLLARELGFRPDRGIAAAEAGPTADVVPEGQRAGGRLKVAGGAQRAPSYAKLSSNVARKGCAG